jgi:hypothetical protein
MQVKHVNVPANVQMISCSVDAMIRYLESWRAHWASFDKRQTWISEMINERNSPSRMSAVISEMSEMLTKLTDEQHEKYKTQRLQSNMDWYKTNMHTIAKAMKKKETDEDLLTAACCYPGLWAVVCD